MSEVQLNAISQISDVAITGHTQSMESMAEIIYENDTPQLFGKTILLMNNDK